MVELATCSWRAYEPEMGVAVRITLGKPPRWFDHEHEQIRLLAPPPAVFRLRDDAAFEAAYEQHLESVGTERLMERFQDLSDKHEGRRLILLCFESRVEDCHRGQFARWWQAGTGIVVPELQRGCGGPRNHQDGVQPSLFDALSAPPDGHAEAHRNDSDAAGGHH